MMETITSLQNPQVKIWRSLNASRAARVKHGLFLAEGDSALISSSVGTHTDGMLNILTRDNGKAKDCIKCGKCERICPQHLPIRELLVQVSEVF